MLSSNVNKSIYNFDGINPEDILISKHVSLPSTVDKSSHKNEAAEAEETSSFAGNILGKLWNLPNTIVGLGLGILGLPFGAKISFGNNAIQFENHPFMQHRSAITLGNVIAYGKGTSPQLIGDHERQHTYQGELLGPVYLFAHLFNGIRAKLNEGYWHGSSNALERGPMKKIPTPWDPR